jgi:chromate transporter
LRERRASGVAYSLEAGQPAPRVTLPALFTTFLQISLIGFGGPIVWARRFLVERQRWLDDQTFAEVLSLCQFLPGPNVICLTVCVGSKFRGPAGALAAVAGFIIIPWTVGFALGALLLHYTQIAVMQNIMRGVSAVGAGLIIATGIRLLRPHRGRKAALLFAGAAFAGLAFANLPLLPLVLVLVPLSITAAYYERPIAG